MGEQRYYPPRLWGPVLGLALASGLQGVVTAWDVADLLAESRISTVLLAIVSLDIVLGSVLGLWKLRDPVLLIAEGRLEQTWLWSLGRRSIAARDVSGIAKAGSRRVVLLTRAGQQASIRLDRLPRVERAEARTAIEQWVAAHVSGEG